MGPERTIGESIRQAREERGLSQEDVSRETRLSLVVLRNLETDHFEELPGGLYVENAIRILAEFLDLDRGTLMARYRDGSREGASKSDSDLAAGVWVEAEVPETRIGGWQPRPRTLILIAIVLILGLLGLAFGLGWLSLPEFGGEPTPETVAIVEDTSSEAIVSPPRPVEERVEADPVPPPSEEQASGFEGPILTPDGNRETLLRREAAMELTVRAHSRCRVQVNMDGGRHLAHALPEGGVWRLQAVGHIVLSVDDGAALTLELDGVPYPLPVESSRDQALALRIDASD